MINYDLTMDTRVQAELLADFLKRIMKSKKDFGFQIKGRRIFIET